MQKSKFVDPPADYRPAPLWVWNDELTPRRVCEQLRQLHRAGMGGVFVHPRPGLISEYLGPEWWKCFAAAVREAKRLGMKLQIYDENSYPSGFAGGHVPAQLPYVAATAVRVRRLGPDESAPDAGSFPNERVYAAASWDGASYVFEPIKGESPGWAPWFGGFGYVDLLRPETTRRFLDITHEQYFKRFGTEFGRTITAAFFDEPMIGSVVFNGSDSLPFSYWFAEQFRCSKGYDLLAELPKLFLPLPGYQKVRYDYYEISHRLWVQNWARPMQDWCRAHGLEVTGHYNEHTWLAPHSVGTPDAMAMYEWMDMPGIDLLGCGLGREGVTASLGCPQDLLLLTVRELLSAVNQVGHKRALCETYGAGGYDSTFEDYKRIGDWLYVHGVNYQSTHFSLMTIRGARKRDHPQTFSEHSPWWPHYKPLCDYFGRLSYVLSQGCMKQRVLLLHPTTSAWVEASPLIKRERSYYHPVMEKTLYKEHQHLVRFLCDRWWDFDLGDEFIIENRGRVEGKSFQVGRQNYQVVILPPYIVNLRSTTLRLLEAFTRAGGRVVMLGGAPELVDGVPDPRVACLARRWQRVADETGLDALLDTTLGRPMRLEGGDGWPDRLAVMRREFGGGRIGYFLVNTGPQRIRRDAVVPERGIIERWDPWTGQMHPVEGPTLPLDLPHAGSALFVIQVGKTSGRTKPAAAPSVAFQPVPLEPLSISRQDPNVLVLDYCNVACAGQTWRDIHHWHANGRISRAHGLDGRAWDRSVQFARTTLDRDRFPKDSGFEAEFHFEVKDRPERLELAVECPELYTIYLNDRRLNWSGAAMWLDTHIRTMAITSRVRTGRNTVRVVGRPYGIRMELEPVYLRGDFALEPGAHGFRVTAAGPLTLGSWRRQGLPFYGDTVRYDYRFRAEAGRSRYVVRLPRWSGSVSAVSVNGKHAGLIAWPGALTDESGYELDITAGVRAGANTLAIAVTGTPKNLLGPFHCNTTDPTAAPPRAAATPDMWHVSPVHGPPAGDRYDLIDYGLMAEPELLRPFRSGEQA